MTHAYATRCPHCGRGNEAATAVVPRSEKRDREPVPLDGSISVCAGCGGVAIFSYMTPGGLRFPQPEELAEIESSPIGRKVLNAWKERTR